MKRPEYVLAICLLFLRGIAHAEGPAPETAPPLFPKGALISYGSDFNSRDAADRELSTTSQPTFSHRGAFIFTWGFYRDFDVTISVPIVTNRFEDGAQIDGTGIGDAMVLLKYRFYRRDSQRGTSQVSVTAGPKFATGSTGFTDPSGVRLPASLQAGSGSTDFFLGLNWTYTGLFNIKRLVADEDFHALFRSTGTQQTNLGNDYESRFWLSYRPYESQDVRREWFIGPTITWLHSNNQEISNVPQNGSGGTILLIGITTYFGISPGLHLWFGGEWDVIHSNGDHFEPVHYHVSLGVTRQFRFF